MQAFYSDVSMLRKAHLSRTCASQSDQTKSYIYENIRFDLAILAGHDVIFSYAGAEVIFSRLAIPWRVTCLKIA
jgi:hypothetical protein